MVVIDFLTRLFMGIQNVPKRKRERQRGEREKRERELALVWFQGMKTTAVLLCPCQE